MDKSIKVVPRSIFNLNVFKCALNSEDFKKLPLVLNEEFKKLPLVLNQEKK